MKICHLTSVHPAEDIRILIKECQSLANAGHDVTLIVANQSEQQKYGVTIKSVDAKANGRIMRMIKGPIQVYKKALQENADVYHFHDPELMPIGLLLKRKGKKVIYDVHEDVPEQVLSKQWIPSRLRRFISRIVKGVERYSAKRFNAIVAATPTIAERFKVYNNNTYTIHNFPILNELLSDGNSKAGTEGNKSKEAQILYIGGITELRGIKEMTKAIEEVNRKNRAKLKLAGKFSPTSLEDEMKKETSWSYVDHLGWLSREEIKDLLSTSDVGMVILRPEPRYIVSYPIKLFEYMSAGIPVIASNFPLWQSIVEGEDCGKCVDPLNIEEIANAITWFIENPEKAKHMGKNGRKAIEEKYNWEKESENLINLYSSL